MRYLFIMMGIVFLFIAQARAETLIAPLVSYDVDSNTDKTAASCDLVITISNYPVSPEVANFRGKIVEQFDDTKLPIVGFTLDVANVKYENGTVTGLEKTPLAQASFASKTINTVGRFYPMIMNDGGAGASTTDVKTGSAFLTAITGGNFDISFSAKDLPEERTYHIQEGAPLDVIHKFRDCVERMPS